MANDPPVNLVPSVQYATENVPLAFTGPRGNLISTSDPDAGDNPVIVNLSADHGVITLVNPDPNGGLTYSVGDGFEDSTMTFTGKISDINEALSWLAFVPDAEYVGTEASVTITTNDQGYFGSGGPQEDIDTIPIEVEAVEFADSPSWTTFPGALDTTFNGNGKQVLSLSNGVDSIREMRQLDDGKILAVGSVNNHFGLMRFNSDLTLDTSFGTNGVTETDVGVGRYAYALEIDQDGKILVGGYSAVARYTPDGQLDTTFGTDGIVSTSTSEPIHDLAIQPDGKILAIRGESGRFRITRYQTDGTFEFEKDYFSTNNSGGHYGRGVIVQNDGDILLVGRSVSPSRFGLYRIDTNGVLEERNFADLPGTSEFVHSILELPDSRLLVIGNDGLGDMAVSRHYADGTLDTTFGTSGMLSIPVLNGTDTGYRASLQADGKILITGYSDNGSNQDITLVRLSYDGVLDTTFDTDGKMSIPFESDNEYGYSVLSLTDGKILIGGRSGNDIALVRLYGDNDQSSADSNAAPVNVVPGVQYATENVPLAFTGPRGNLISTSDPDAGDNPVIVNLSADHGVITLVNPDPNGGLTYSVGDGFEDSTMTFTGKISDINEALSWLAFVPDAEYVGTEASVTITTNDQGYFGSGGPQEDIDTIPIEVEAVEFADSPSWTTFPGALDTTFNGNGKQVLSLSNGVDSIREMRQLDDGKILAVGSVNNHFGLMRFNSDLTLDTSFGTNGVTETDVGVGRYAYALEIDQDGKILVGGYSAVARYTPDGQLDTTFGTDGIVSTSTSEPIHDLAIQPDGKILAIRGESGRFRITRYQTDGTFEFEKDYFSTNNSGGHYGRGVIVQNDGDILLVGRSVSPSRFGLYRIDTNGVLEERNFADLPGTSEFVHSILELPDSRLLVIGNDGLGDMAVSRHYADGTLDTTFGTSGMLSIPVLNGTDTGYRASLQADGKILITGYSDNGSNQDITLVRLSYDGVLDTTFDTDGKMSIPFESDNEYGYSVLSLTDGKILIGGRSGNDIALVRLYGDNDVFNEANPIPELDAIEDIWVDWNGSEQEMLLSGISAGGDDDQNLRILVSSSDPNVVNNLSIEYTSPNSTGVLRLTPVQDAIGFSTISVTVEDAGDDGDFATSEDNASFTREFIVHVNTTPSFDPISDLDINEDSSQQVVDIANIQAGGGEEQNLRVTASTDNVDLIPNLSLDYTSPNSTGSLAFTPVADRYGVATITVTVEDGGDDDDLATPGDNLSFSRTFQVTVNSVNDIPLLAPIDDIAIGEDASEQVIDLTGIFAGGGEEQSLRVTATSDNVALIPDPTVTYNSPESTGTLSFTPVADQNGTATITVTVEDGGDDNDLATTEDNLSFSRTFEVTVNPVNDIPLLAPIDDITIGEDASEQVVDLTGIFAGGGEEQNLRITATSDNVGLVPNPTVTYSSPETTGSLAFTPIADQHGVATITVTVEDGGDDNDLATTEDNLIYSRTFDVTVNPANDIPDFTLFSAPTDAGTSLGLVYFDQNGHWYQVIEHGESLDWHDAATLANSMLGNGESGYLATFTSAEEWDFVLNELLEPNRTEFGNGWIGATDEISEGNFEWVTGEAFSYDDPATFDNLNNEDYAVVWRFGVNDPLQWNDIRGVQQRLVVEYGEGTESAIAIDEDAGEQIVNIAGIDAGDGEEQNLRITATSDNVGLIPNPTVNYTSPNATGSLSFTPVADQSGVATITVTVEDGGDDNDLATTEDNLSFSRTFEVTVNPVNDIPLLAPIDDVTIGEDTSEQVVDLTGIFAGGGEEQNLRITATSDNVGLIPNPAVTYASPETTGSLALTPIADQSGVATITVTVEDGGNDNDLATTEDNQSFSRTFEVTVNPVNDIPLLAPIDDITIGEDSSEQVVDLTGIFAGGGEEQNLRITATSDNVGLIPNPAVTYASPETTGSLALTPVADQYGVATITVTVEDGGNDNDLATTEDNLSFSRTFEVTVNPVNDIPLLAPIDDVTIGEDASEQVIDLTGIFAGGGEEQNLQITASSDDVGLIPNPAVTYASPQTTGSLTFTPVADQFGVTTITVTVEDGGDDNDLGTTEDNLTFSRTFEVTVSPVNDIPLLAPIDDATL
ncbi:Ig-like domain-containing protein, partial [bacterium]|nr:Ig-like domain-containing protein [bacterium]